MVELNVSTPEGSARFDELQRRIDAAHDTQMQNLTRLRLVSTSDVVEAAHEVHELDHEVIGATLAESPDDEVDDVRERLRLARSRMVSASRRAIGLPDPSGTSTAGL